MITMHPGRYISQVYLSDDLTQSMLANKLKVSPAAVSRLLNEKSDLSAEMAIKLSEVLGRSADSWMRMQTQYSLQRARRLMSNAQPEHHEP